MKILVAGASGFIGSYLTGFMLKRAHHVIGVARSQPKQAILDPNYRFIAADTTLPGPWQESLADVEAVINLAGRSIFGRWNPTVKTEIRESRIRTTHHVVQGLPSGKPTVLINASGVGHYGNRGDEVLAEEASAGDDFLARLSVDWEEEALAAEAKGARVVLTRFGVVLGKGGGAMAQMIPAFKSFLGGPLGNGRQWFPWIHIEDLAEAMQFLIDRPEISGPVNCLRARAGPPARFRRSPRPRLETTGRHAGAGLHGAPGPGRVRRGAARQPARDTSKTAATPVPFSACAHPVRSRGHRPHRKRLGTQKPPALEEE